VDDRVAQIQKLRRRDQDGRCIAAQPPDSNLPIRAAREDEGRRILIRRRRNELWRHWRDALDQLALVRCGGECRGQREDRRQNSALQQTRPAHRLPPITRQASTYRSSWGATPLSPAKLSLPRFARGERAAQRTEHLKKGEMAEQAQALLAGSSWLPEPLRTPGRALPSAAETAVIEPAMDEAVEETAAADGETAMVDPEQRAEDEPVATEPRAAEPPAAEPSPTAAAPLAAE